MSTDHLTALHFRLTNEKHRLEIATTNTEKEIRRVWIAQIEKEIEKELDFLGMTANNELPEMTDEEILKELGL